MNGASVTESGQPRITRPDSRHVQTFLNLAKPWAISPRTFNHYPSEINSDYGCSRETVGPTECCPNGAISHTVKTISIIYPSGGALHGAPFLFHFRLSLSPDSHTPKITLFSRLPMTPWSSMLGRILIQLLSFPPRYAYFAMLRPHDRLLLFFKQQQSLVVRHCLPPPITAYCCSLPPTFDQLKSGTGCQSLQSWNHARK